jgi:hypothetical protein
MNQEITFGRLARALGITRESLGESIGENWTTSFANPDLLIRGDDSDLVFFDEDEDDAENTEDTYPDVGILVQDSAQVQIGTLKALYDPAPSGYDIETMITLSGKTDLVVDKLVEAIEIAAKAYLESFTNCMYCKEALPPYVMSEDGYCYGCGSKELGIVY